jgi:hypothetical protein
MKTLSLSLAAAIASLGIAFSAKADTTQARCDVYPRGEDTVLSYGPCTFSQRQGYVTITLEDGTTYELSPDPKRAAIYTDQDGRRATREDTGDTSVTIYRLADVSIFVYWGAGDTGSGNTVAYREPQRGGGYFPCSIVQPDYEDTCEASVVFGDPGNATLTLTGVMGSEHHLAVYEGELYSTDVNDEVLVQVLDGIYYVNINDEEFFQLDEIIVTGAD